MHFALLAAFIAFLSWGFGDFSIQRSVRAVGSAGSLFAIAAFGSVALLPFAWHDIPQTIGSHTTVLLLITAAGAMTFAAIFEFASLKIGKLAVTEPVLSLELVFTAAISIGFLGEHLSRVQLLLAFCVFLGIVLTVTRRERFHWWQRWEKRHGLEQGVLLALAGTVFMTFANIFTGLSSRASNPIVTIWFMHVLIGAVTLVWMLLRHEWQRCIAAMQQHWRPVLAASVFDNAAWVAYSAAAQQLPIALTISITESYIALACFLGIVWNKEHVQRHQVIGMVTVIVAAVLLGAVSGY